MSLRILLFVLLCTATAFQQADRTPPSSFTVLKKLIREKNFFAARAAYGKQSAGFTAFQKHYAEAFLDGAFNRLEPSTRHIDHLLKGNYPQLKDSDRVHLLQLQQANWGKLYEYAKAASVLRQLLNQYPRLLTQEERDDARNTLLIWTALAGVPRQTVTISETARLPIHRDRAGLPNLSVQAADTTFDFVFDTGANLSTITTSTAKRLGVQLLADSIQVGSITGQTVEARLGHCSSLQLGPIKVQDVVFLVLPDSALAFPQVGYQIHGILGFPVIEAFKEVTITRTDTLLVPQKQTLAKEQNLAIDFLTLILNIDGEAYTFDSGATTTLLYQNYFSKYKKQIQSRYREEALPIGGAGGGTSSRGYKVSFQPRIGDRKIRLDSVYLFPQPRKVEDRYYYGNIGQDLIRHFHSVTLNFSSMFIRFD